MHGFGSHTFSFINAQNERYRVKFRFRTQQGIKTLTDADTEAVIGKDRESHQRDLLTSIDNGDLSKWNLLVQTMPEGDAYKVSYNPFDLTKVWSHKDYPEVEVGFFELNRNPETSLPKLNNRRSTRPGSYPASVSAGTRYCRLACSPTATRSITGLASTITRFR